MRVEKMFPVHIPRAFLICLTKTSSDILKKLKTWNDKNNVHDDARRGHLARNNIEKKVKQDWAKYDTDALYQKVYNKF